MADEGLRGPHCLEDAALNWGTVYKNTSSTLSKYWDAWPQGMNMQYTGRGKGCMGI